MELYVVKRGDNVDSISRLRNISVQRLIWENQLEYPYRLAVGQALYISGEMDGKESGEGQREGEDSGEKTGEMGKRKAFSSGYAYPFIGEEPLEQVLPYLSAVNVFSYGFTEEGNLIHPAVDDGPVLEKAREAGVSPVLTLTPIGSDGHFNNHLVSALVRNADRQQRLLWEIGAVMLEKGYEGLDIDFEYVLGEDREAFAAFVERSARLLHVFGYVIRVALAPKTSSDQKGLLYEGIDYRLLGEAADQVLLMTYEWGYSQGPPMAVAPLPMVRRVVEYALTQIPREKILLGMPNYGYDWPLPYERGVTRARSLGLLEAVELAVWYGVKIEFDQKAQSPYFRYWQYGVQHEVWFEDPRSILAKYGLIREYGLYGFGVWQLMRFFRAGWLMMEELFRIDRG